MSNTHSVFRHGCWEVVSDAYGWQVREWRDAVKPDAKDSQYYDARYYPTLMQCCQYILDREAGVCAGVEQVMDRWDTVVSSIRVAAQKIESHHEAAQAHSLRLQVVE